jgi:DNA-binding NtrC family response regulator
VIALQVPSLRKRREDILPLAEYFLGGAAAHNHWP